MAKVVPDANSQDSKKKQVSDMFDDISPKYDLLNRVLSMGIDISWRKKVVKLLKKQNPQSILDVATGTADLAIALTKTGANLITGIDISAGMLEVGRKKVQALSLDQKILLQKADAENLPFQDKTFDAVTVAFGVRNFENLEKGLSELHRVLKPHGTLVVLEFSQPTKFPFSQIYQFYFKNVLPLIGKMVSKNASAYTYLPASVSAFPFGKDFETILRQTGFIETQWKELTFGIATIYWGRKK
jgi:demethylmenaquinone methyltransferase/2-methoxy-6-polyprenyl-1,4-benzoquinol methylase